MKKLIAFVCVFALTSTFVFSQVQPGQHLSQQRNAAGTATPNQWQDAPTNGVAQFKIVAGPAGFGNFAPATNAWFGHGFSYNPSTVTVSVGGLNSSDVGLGNVDNTSDANKPVSTATQAALDLKASASSVTSSISSATNALGTAIYGYLDTLVDSIESALSGKSDVGHTHAYGTLTGLPSIPSDQIQSDWAQSNSGSLDFIKNKPTLPTFYTTNITRSLNSSFQPNTSRPCMVTYTVRIAATLSLVTGQSGTVFLETSPDNSTWTEVSRIENGNTGSLTVGLNLTQTVASQVSSMVPTGYYARLRTNGTATFTYVIGQEIYF